MIAIDVASPFLTRLNWHWCIGFFSRANYSLSILAFVAPGLYKANAAWCCRY